MGDNATATARQEEPAEGIELDLSAFPLVFTHYWRSPSLDDFHRFERRVEDGIFGGEGRYVSVTDMSSVRIGDPKLRRAGAALAARIEVEAKRRSVGSVIIVRSAITRGIIIAVRWIARPVVPEFFASNRRDAAEIAERLLIEAGVAIPEATRAKLESLRLEG